MSNSCALRSLRPTQDATSIRQALEDSAQSCLTSIAACPKQLPRRRYRLAASGAKAAVRATCQHNHRPRVGPGGSLIHPARPGTWVPLCGPAIIPRGQVQRHRRPIRPAVRAHNLEV